MSEENQHPDQNVSEYSRKSITLSESAMQSIGSESFSQFSGELIFRDGKLWQKEMVFKGGVLVVQKFHDVTSQIVDLIARELKKGERS